VIVSLALITASFRESSDGRVHGVESLGASAMKPFEVAARRVARPFRDVYHWFDGLVDARSENQKLKQELRDLRQNYTRAQTAENENAVLQDLLDYERGPRFPSDYRAVNASVIGQPPGELQQQIMISAGSRNGVREDDPVVTADGLVGKVTRVAPAVAQVTLLTDPTSAVAARDLGTRASGLIRHGAGGGTVLFFDRVEKREVVRKGDTVVTAGTQVNLLPDLYPRGLPIGMITSFDQRDTDTYKRIQVEPFVDFSSLDAVAVLVPEERAR
jgi:rod shape-determining protein MreC